MDMIERLPTLVDSELVVLLTNATRWETSGNPKQQAQAQEMIPLIRAEIAQRKARNRKPPKPKAPPKVKAVKEPKAPKVKAEPKPKAAKKVAAEAAPAKAEKKAAPKKAPAKKAAK